MLPGERKLDADFFKRDVLEVAPDLLGKQLLLNKQSFVITEVEAYRGEEDKACHASKGRTQRTEIMYHAGGVIYVYLIYGVYWMLNFVTGERDNPQAILIRGINKKDNANSFFPLHLNIYSNSFYLTYST